MVVAFAMAVLLEVGRNVAAEPQKSRNATIRARLGARQRQAVIVVPRLVGHVRSKPFRTVDPADAPRTLDLGDHQAAVHTLEDIHLEPAVAASDHMAPL